VDGTGVIRPFQLPSNVAAGGAAMSLSSLLRYAEFHLSRESLAELRASRLVKNATTDEMGLGWQLRRLDGIWTAAHGGTLEGHCLHLQLVAERNLACRERRRRAARAEDRRSSPPRRRPTRFRT
jgi:CubicO group peptidase (beta-lactamase class C family)